MESYSTTKDASDIISKDSSEIIAESAPAEDIKAEAIQYGDATPDVSLAPPDSSINVVADNSLGFITPQGLLGSGTGYTKVGDNMRTADTISFVGHPSFPKAEYRETLDDIINGVKTNSPVHDSSDPSTVTGYQITDASNDEIISLGAGLGTAKTVFKKPATYDASAREAELKW